MHLRIVAAVALTILTTTAGPPCRADTVILTSGKKIKGVVVSRQDDEVVVINRFRSRHADMTWGIDAKDRIPRAKVAEIIVGDAPLVAYREKASGLELSVEDHLQLVALCATHKFKEERLRHLRQRCGRRR